MDKKSGKRILATAIGGVSLLLVAGIIWLVTALILKWNIWSWWTTTQAYLVYFLFGFALIYLGVTLFMYFKFWRYK